MKVPGYGPPDAKIVIIGEAPGETEERTGLPFQGGSGQLLNQILARVGINRHECYITNVVKERPPRNDFSTLYLDGPARKTPSPSLNFSIAELHSELRRIRPTIIIPLGGESLRAVTGKTSIDKWRGSIIPSSFGKVVPTYHPAHILRVFSSLPIFEHDLTRAKEESEFPQIKDLGHQLELGLSYDATIRFLQSLIDSPRPISFDIETTKQMNIRCLALADSATHAVEIPFMSSSRRQDDSKTTIFVGPTSSSSQNSHWEEEEEYQILRLLDQIFSLPSIRKYAQNFSFDAQVLGREFGFKIHGLSCDTMVAAHTMYCELPKGLDFLASLYTRVPYYSDYDGTSDLELWRYNCFDACVTYEIADTLGKDLGETHPAGSSFSSADFFSNHIQPAMQVMTRVGTRGVLMDTKVRDDLKTKYTVEREVYLKEFQKLSGSDINPASTKQMQELLYDRLKLPVQLHRKSKRPTVDEDAIERLTKRFPQHQPMFDALLDWRERQKLITTYLDIPLDTEGRIRTTFNVVGTVTGRCNSAATLWGEGSNLQNIPVRSDLGKPLRRMFVADQGYVLIKCDLSQAEFRLVVWFAKIRRLIERYLQDPNFDVHKWVASLIFKIPESEVQKLQRDIAKNGVYGGNYAMQPPTAARTYKLNLKDATFVLNEYRKAIPEVPNWWKVVERVLAATRTLVNPLGRVRVVMDRLDDATFRDCYSHECQSTVADLIHRASILTELLCQECQPVLQVHDELVLHCKLTALGQNLPLIKQIMEYPLQIPGVPEPLIIPAELSYGPNWLDQKKWTGETVA